MIPIVPNVNGTMISIGLNLVSPGSNGLIRFAVYNSSGSNPSYILNQTSNISTISGWNNASLMVPFLAGTTYWIAYNLNQTTTDIYYSAGSGSSKYKMATFGVFPDPMISPLSSTDIFNMDYSIRFGNPITYYWTAI
jgi:hypothetical protein